MSDDMADQLIAYGKKLGVPKSTAARMILKEFFDARVFS